MVETSVGEPYKSIAQIAANLASTAAIASAAAWFFLTTKFRRRIQFDLDCKTYALATNPSRVVAEIQLIFENKGFVEHRVYNLTLSIHSLKSELDITLKKGTGELEFATPVLSKTNIVPSNYNYYFVRPGVRQIVTHIVSVPAEVSIIRITAGFDYDAKGDYPHTVRRVFPVVPLSGAEVTPSTTD